MNDNYIFTNLIASLGGFKIKQAYVGKVVRQDDVIYVHKIVSPSVGTQHRKYTHTGSAFDLVESQIFSTTLQFTSRDVDSLSNLYQTINSISVIKMLKSSGLGVGLTTDIRQPTGIDKKGDFIINSNFDLVLTYTRTLTATVPEAAPVAEIKRV
tara:strand:- start:558 stop:1019 length:462 start_codon:yes stop_codon:yes gene_type:complete